MVNCRGENMSKPDPNGTRLGNQKLRFSIIGYETCIWNQFPVNDWLKWVYERKT